MTVLRRVLCTGDSAALAPVLIRDLADLLARALAEQMDEWAVVHELGSNPVLFRKVTAPLVITSIPLTFEALKLAVDTQTGGGPPATARAIHYLVIEPTNGPALSYFLGVLGDKAFDVVTPVVQFAGRDAAIALAATKAVQWLKSSTGRMMPAVLLPTATGGHAGAFEILEIPPGWSIPTPPERDACRMRFTSADVGLAKGAPAWTNVPTSIKGGFERWARTVSWRRVGFVISGGGASVFRLHPFFKLLEAKGVPIDLLCGVSGGTLFSACYAVGGLPKLEAFAAGGGLFTGFTVAALGTSWVISAYVDAFLGRCGVNNTEIRVVALSTRFPPGEEPHACAVLEGTFGEAIRASGGAPFFGPYFHLNARQLDGGLMAVVPPPVVAEQFGADIIFSANVMALPEGRFPGDDSSLVGDALGLVYRYTPFGRVADLWNASTVMMHSLARAYSDQADAQLNTAPNDWSLIEPFEYFRAAEFAGFPPTAEDQTVSDQCKAAWEALD